MNKFFLTLSFIALIIADWLAFHDVAESHTFRDWLVALATLLVLISLFSRRKQTV